MQLIAAGTTNRQIASRLVLSESTVHTHCEKIFQRLDVSNRVAAIAKGIPSGDCLDDTRPICRRSPSTADCS